MKKLEKILVIILTLAMILSMAVISATAANSPISYTAGGTTSYFDTLNEAFEKANADSSGGDVVIKLNDNVTVSDAIFVTRASGKIILDLNGKTLTTNVKTSIVAEFKYTDTGATKTHVKPNYVNVEDADGNSTMYYITNLVLHDAYRKSAGAQSASDVISSGFVAEETYVGTVYNGIEVYSTSINIGTFTLGENANLELVGNDSKIVDNATGSGMLFYVPQEVENATVYAHDFSASIKSGQSWDTFAGVYGGDVTIENAIVSDTANGTMFRQGNGGELTVKNSVLSTKTSGANESIVKSNSNNSTAANDGYEIEFINCSILSHGNVLSGPGADSSTLRAKRSSQTYNGITNGVRTSGITMNVAHFTAFDRIHGTSFVPSSMLIENCNVETANYSHVSENNRNHLITHGGINVDFKNSSVFVAQNAMGFVSDTVHTYNINFYDCIFEFTGKGNLISGGQYFLRADAFTDHNVSFYGTELRVSSLYKDAGYTNATYSGRAASVYRIFIGEGTLIDAAFGTDTLLLADDDLSFKTVGESGDFIAVRGAKLPADYAITSADKATMSWSSSSSASYDVRSDSTALDGGAISASVVGWHDAAALIARGTGSSVELLASVDKATVLSPVTIKTNGFTFNWGSFDYKATVANGVYTFTEATDADKVKVTVNYGDGVGDESFSYVKGSIFQFDTSRIPEKLSGFDAALAQDYALFYGGKALTAAKIAELSAPMVINSSVEIKITRDVTKQYGWAIYDSNGDVLSKEKDVGNTWAELATRIKTIEVIANPLTNSADVADTKDGKMNFEAFYSTPLTTDSYTIKLFADFDDATKLTIYNQATKTVTLDLNGHSVTAKDDYLIFAFAIRALWDVAPDGNVVGVIGHNLETNTSANTTAATGYIHDPANTIIKALNYNLTVKIVSSKTGAAVNSSYADGIAATLFTQNIFYDSTNGSKKDASYPKVSLYIGEASTAAIGHDDMAISVNAPMIAKPSGSNSYVYVSNVIAKLSAATPIIVTAGHFIMDGTTVFATSSSASAGLINTGNGHKETKIKNSNLISAVPRNLFSVAGCDAGDAETVLLTDTRIINFYLAANSKNYDTSTSREMIVLIGEGCYYNLPYDASKANSVELASSKITASKISYAQNVIISEAVEILGVKYALCYKVAPSSEVVGVSWLSPDGATLIKSENYLKGEKIVALKEIDVDIISKVKYTWESFDEIASGDISIKAISIRPIPKLNIINNISLQNNLVHNVKIARYLIQGRDILDFITKITVSNVVVYDRNSDDNILKLTSDNSYYYFALNVKSNEVADDYTIKFDFVNEAGTAQSATLSTSIISYVEYGLGVEKKDSNLYNLYTAIIHYADAAYDYFGGTEQGESAITELAAKYPASDFEIGGGEAIDGDELDLEFLLDSNVVYRIYVTGENAEYSWLELSYTKLDGSIKEITVEEYGCDDKGFYYDLTLPAYEFLTDIDVTLYVGDDAVSRKTFNIADYFETIKNYSNAKLIALIKALYRYAESANVYMANKSGNDAAQTDKIPSVSGTADTLSSGEQLVVAEDNIFFGEQKITVGASFDGTLGENEAIIFGHGYNKKNGSYIKITGTQVIFITYTSATAVSERAFEHGLTITNRVFASIYSNESYATVTIGDYSVGYSWQGRAGDVFVMAEGLTLNDVSLKFEAIGLGSEDVWLFGDSYLNYTSTSRWLNYLRADGYTIAPFGYPGMPTTPGAPAFRWAVEEMGAKPRYAIWALGMNNGDKLGNEVPAAAWLTATEEFIEICSDNGIIPILATIPSTPTAYNELKNAWVRESGYRYIDFAEAVAYYDEALIGTDTEKEDGNGGFVKNTTGFAWYDDMLSIDQVHPAASGAIALYEKVLEDFPEIKNSKSE